MNGRHLRRVLTGYLEHYNTSQHRGINLEMPMPAPGTAVTALAPADEVERVDVFGGLIHEYRRAA